jgi:hypothetical protein
MWCINHQGFTLQEVLIMAYMNILEATSLLAPSWDIVHPSPMPSN